ncbi:MULTISPECIES: 3-hydroxyacyl-CoA dehydrogenase family protein [Bacillaceae]|uniref:3-hydroxyacyl-CoA dehydrogenase family protein n=1 Tax=Niallia hominis TaxID=3133173 RepID=A0ABV1F0W9_9BACI|nr:MULTISPECIES: 3-hydroxyacyl-CoA dehydrogenase family protein [Bacillaceae]MCF2647086.1 3-hydroxyacyl-CoA dehydrogenase family protein [Niallia circulans]CAI9392979.1 3-hydroxybutyryl-CoA dehydrogenase [Bacillus sp. T2.9-1]
MSIKTVGIVGAGSMGTGIANAFILNGYHVVLHDIKEHFLENSLNRMTQFMTKSIERGKLTETKMEEALSLLKTTTNLQDFENVDLVVEAVLEDINLKKSVFAELDRIVREDVILATNTSSMSITEISFATQRPDHVAGFHFFNPAQLMKLIEIVYGLETSDETINRLKKVAESLNKIPVVVKKDSPGFVVNRILMPFYIEATKVLEEDIASKEDIDKAIKYGLNHPMGPFELQDYAGVDISFHVMEYLQKEYSDNRFSPPLLLKTMMRAGRFGRKTGAGFYKYEK